MMRRRGGPGVLSTMARTAVISGTATATANRVNARAATKAQHAQQQVVQQQAAQMQQQEAAIENAVIDDTIARLKELAQLKDVGMLTDEEFAAAKAKVLAG